MGPVHEGMFFLTAQQLLGLRSTRIPSFEYKTKAVKDDKRGFGVSETMENVKNHRRGRAIPSLLCKTAKTAAMHSKSRETVSSTAANGDDPPSRMAKKIESAP